MMFKIKLRNETNDKKKLNLINSGILSFQNKIPGWLKYKIVRLVNSPLFRITAT